MGVFQLHIQADVERFIALHKKLLRWWLGRYIPSYIKDIADNAAADPVIPENWIISWRQAVAKCGCLVNHLPAFFLRSHTGSPGENLQIEDFDMTRLPEEQSAHPLDGAEDERVTLTLQQDDTESDDDGKSTVYLR